MADSQHNSRELEAKLRSACMQVTTLLGQGQSRAAEVVLGRFPDLAAEEEAALEIIYTEFQALDEAGQRPPMDQWLEQYPQHRTRLERLIKLHDLMDESDADADSHPAVASSNSLGTVGNYQLLAELGRGGMGVVYRARQVGLGREVAVKVLQASDGLDSQRSRFIQEAEAIAALQHPNIVQIFEIGSADQRDYLSMELLEGGSLESWMQGPQRSNHEIALLVKYLADAIGFAHQHGIIHRDLKPANVLLTAGGQPKVVDFGLAKRLDQAARVKTQTGAVLGTPSYMSPEQASGESREVGPGSDIFSLGVILYQLLTRQLPFDGQSAVETLKQIVEREPTAPGKLRPDVPRDLETICLKCLNKEPKGRYASALELASDLARFLDHRPILARRASFWEKSCRTVVRHREVSILACTLVLLVGVGLSLLFWQRWRLQLAERQAGEQAQLANAQQKRANEAEEAYEASLKRARELLGRTTDLGVKLEFEPGFDETRRKAFEDAANYYEEFLEKHEGDPTIRIEAAQAAMRSASLHADLGMWTEAEGRLNRANQWLLELSDNRNAQWLRSDCLLQLANCQRRLERWSESESTFNALIDMLEAMLEKTPNHVGGLLRRANAQANLCTILRSQNRWDESLPVYLDALDQCLKAAKLSARLPLVEQRPNTELLSEKVQQRVTESAELREKLMLLPANPNRNLPYNPMGELALSLDDIALSLQAKSEPAAAEQCLRESLALRTMIVENTNNNRFMEQYLARSMTNLAEHLDSTGRSAESIELLSGAEKLYAGLVKDFPDRFHYRSELASSLVQTSRSLNSLGRYTESIEVGKKALTLNEQLVAQHPGNQTLLQDLVACLLPLGYACSQSGDIERSHAHYRRAIEIQPTMPFAYNSLAWQMCLNPAMAAKDYEQAVQLAKKAVELSPNSSSYWNTLTLALYRHGSFSEAATAAVRSRELSSGGLISDWYFQAMLSAKLGKQPEAQVWYQRAEARRQVEAANNSELLKISKEAAEALAQLPQ